MKLETLSIITYLLPLTVSLLGALTIFGNRHRGISRNLFGYILFLMSYKFGYDLLSVMRIDTLQIIAFIAGSLIWYSLAPLLYRYFSSLQSHDFILDRLLIKHFLPGLLIGITVLGFTLLLGKDTYVEVLNHRFNQDPSFQKSAYKTILFLLGSPLLTFQWLIYFYFLQSTINDHKKSYGIFYGSYERRNEILMKRIYFSMASIFLISFFAQFFQIQEPVYMILINLIQSVAAIIVVQSAKEQIDMKNYRMYKLSSHHEEILNNKKVNKL